jgi:hypothetical protein
MEILTGLWENMTFKNALTTVVALRMSLQQEHVLGFEDQRQ